MALIMDAIITCTVGHLGCLERLSCGSSAFCETVAPVAMMLTDLFDMVGAHMLERSGPEHHTLIDTGFIRHPIDSGLSWITAQLPAPIAIAEADAAAAKGLWAAIVELILKPAMVGAIGPAAERIDS